ncbi:MAG: hypothetical protein ACRDHL_06640, partial [Candidatus Promineifilaceae bacterium]
SPGGRAVAPIAPAWRLGRAFFAFRDHAGRHGPRGRTRLAWQLPNSYLGPHQRGGRGRQKRINRRLADLFAQGITGNDKAALAVKPPGRRYWRHGAAAGACFNRSPQQEVYWPAAGRLAGPGLWHTLGGPD